MIPIDKQLHFFAGGFLFGTAAPHVGWLWAMAIVAVAAFGKEIYDHLNRDRHTPDLVDALATIAGGLVVAVVAGL